MKSFIETILFGITIAVCSTATNLPCWAQQGNQPRHFDPAELVDSEIVILNITDSLPMQQSESQGVEGLNANNLYPVEPYTFSTHAETDCESCDSCEPSGEFIVTDEQMFPEVKNANFFGVDREKCCDEWAGLCKMKSLKYRCNCGGLKANKGHLGLRWLRSRNAAEGCDFCNGGCCDSGGGCDRKGCLGKSCRSKKSDNASCGCHEKSKQRFVFGRPVESSCQECSGTGRACPAEEGCESCK